MYEKHKEENNTEKSKIEEVNETKSKKIPSCYCYYGSEHRKYKENVRNRTNKSI